MKSTMFFAGIFTLFLIIGFGCSKTINTNLAKLTIFSKQDSSPVKPKKSPFPIHLIWQEDPGSTFKLESELAAVEINVLVGRDIFDFDKGTRDVYLTSSRQLTKVKNSKYIVAGLTIAPVGDDAGVIWFYYDMETSIRYQVILHELLHSIRAEHSSNQKSIMFPTVSKEVKTLSQDDVENAKKLVLQEELNPQ